ncbi:MAG: hypothetical protein ACYCQJ_10905 [Nitrososphaerales archaeon]
MQTIPRRILFGIILGVIILIALATTIAFPNVRIETTTVSISSNYAFHFELSNQRVNSETQYCGNVTYSHKFECFTDYVSTRYALGSLGNGSTINFDLGSINSSDCCYVDIFIFGSDSSLHPLAITSAEYGNKGCFFCTSFSVGSKDLPFYPVYYLEVGLPYEDFETYGSNNCNGRCVYITGSLNVLVTSA